MDKKEYLNFSIKNKLTPRCPIINICQRKAYTVYFFSYLNEGYSNAGGWEELLDGNGEFSDEYFKHKIEIQGEFPTIIKGQKNWFFTNTCPEVCLFKGEHTPNGFDNRACTSGSWDNDNGINENRILEEKHYLECAEFSKFLDVNKFSRNINQTKKVRKKIPQEVKVRAQLQKDINSNCPFCKNDDVGHFQIHHIDGDPSNNLIANLILLCPICHSKITKGDISFSKVKAVKDSLLIR